jgi:thiamine-monophosphate kinase
MKVSELGEFGLIHVIRRLVSYRAGIKRAQTVELGIGDDAAVLRPPRGLTLATTDTMVQNIHFRLEHTSLRDLGWKALAINLSDIAAMGGYPLNALVSLSIPSETDVRSILDFYRGFLTLADQEGVELAGGNLSFAPQWVINVTIMGETGPGRKHLVRSGAKPGDLIAVTGWPGLSAAALRFYSQASGCRVRSRSIFARSHRHPEPRLAEGRLLKTLGIKAAIDVSDGLLADLGHICEESRVSAVVYKASLPVHPRLKAVFPDEAEGLVMAGGEDYELVFTGPASAVRLAAGRLKVPVTIIGEVLPRGRVAVQVRDKHGQVCKPPGGWDHFRSAISSPVMA